MAKLVKEVSKEEKKEIENAVRNRKSIQFCEKGSNDWKDAKSMVILNWKMFDYRLKPAVKKEKIIKEATHE